MNIELSLNRQRDIFQASLILNPVENIPFESDISPTSGFLHGLYNSDKLRNRDQKLDTIIQFAGRNRVAHDVRRIYDHWTQMLGAADTSLRLLSGLHAHAIFFMGLARPGQCVYLLPEIGGGHMSTKTILERIGLNVIEIPVDLEKQGINMVAAIKKGREIQPDFLFIDRSEGLVYEDFSPLVKALKCTSIFDASQYLSNVLAGDYPSPFDMGFDYILSSLHKNFPGPQRALIACQQKTPQWEQLLKAISTFVSNMHVYGIYSAGLTLARDQWIKKYSRTMLSNTITLHDQLRQLGVPSIPRSPGCPPTHHLWIQAPSREQAFDWFERLERCRVLTNYRKLPYNQGWGLRLGMAAATRLGFTEEHMPTLAKILVGGMGMGTIRETRHAVRASLKAINYSRSSTTTGGHPT